MARRNKKNMRKTSKGGWDAKVPQSKSVSNSRVTNDKSESKSGANDAVLNHNEAATSTTADNSRGGDYVDHPSARTAGNDPEWYSRDNQLVVDAASLPFSEPLGDTLDLMTTGELIGYDTNETPNAFRYTGGVSGAIPGILTLKTKASFGHNEDIKSPLNVCAQMLYTHVRYMNSGRKNYDPADLMMYVISMADIYSFLVWCERIYAKAFIYSQRNKYIGKALLVAENIDPDSVVQNLANFRYWINTIINKVAAYAIPADLYYFNRRVWIYSGIYLENPDQNIKDQMYQFTPDGFYRFAIDNNSAGMLEYRKISQILDHSDAVTFSDITKIFNWLMFNVTGDEDFGLMSGDLMKAFEGKIIQLPQCPEVVDISPVYSEYVLLQMHNATVVNAIRGMNDGHFLGDVIQNPNNGVIITKEAVSHSSMRDCIASLTRKLLDVNTPMPNPIDVMEASRLTIVAGQEHDSESDSWMLRCGADLVVDIAVTQWKRYANNFVNKWYGPNAFSNSASDEDLTDWLTLLSMFKYAPIAYEYAGGGESGDDMTNVTGVDVRGQVNNYTIVDEQTLSKMHEVALLSLLSVPGVAKLINVM